VVALRHKSGEVEFAEFVAARIKSALDRDDVTKNSVVAVFGVGIDNGTGIVEGTDALAAAEGNALGASIRGR